MLIKINSDTYIDPECIEAVQKQIIYLGDHSGKIVDTVIYTRGGEKFYYDGTLEECIERLNLVNNSQELVKDLVKENNVKGGADND